MYTQALNAGDPSRPEIAAQNSTPQDPALLARFQSRCDAEDKIEPNDFMPEDYRRLLVRQISSSHGPLRSLVQSCW